MIKRLVIAGLGIQMSWFLCATMIDLSTIGLTGISGITTQVLSEGNHNIIESSFKGSNYYETLFKKDKDTREEAVLDHIIKFDKNGDGLPTVSIQKAETQEESLSMILDGFLPDRNDFSGPLMFI